MKWVFTLTEISCVWLFYFLVTEKKYASGGPKLLVECF